MTTLDGYMPGRRTRADLPIVCAYCKTRLRYVLVNDVAGLVEREGGTPHFTGPGRTICPVQQARLAPDQEQAWRNL